MSQHRLWLGQGDPDEMGEIVLGFRSKRGGGAVARFNASQASILRTLVSQVTELIGPAEEKPDEGLEDDLAALTGLPDLPEDAGQPSESEDPVLARLFPDAYREDADAAGDFRRYTEGDLKDGKLAAAETILNTLPPDGGRVELSADDAQAWLRALNDVRLALGVRLSITEDFEEERARLGADDPRGAYLGIYDWLTFLQETLIRALP